MRQLKASKNYTGQIFGRLTVLNSVKIPGKHNLHLKCKCMCGKITVVNLYKVLSGHTKGCGCVTNKGMEYHKRDPFGQTTFKCGYSIYKRNAKRRNIIFSLTEDEVKILFSQKCYYCGCEPSGIIKSQYNNGDLVFNGIDRVDNDKPYEISNCVSCCKECNYLKTNSEISEFKNWIETVYKNTIHISIL